MTLNGSAGAPETIGLAQNATFAESPAARRLSRTSCPAQGPRSTRASRQLAVSPTLASCSGTSRRRAGSGDLEPQRPAIQQHAHAEIEPGRSVGHPQRELEHLPGRMNSTRRISPPRVS